MNCVSRPVFPRGCPREAGPRPQSPLEGEEALLYEMLSDRPLHIDDLIVKTGIPAGRVASLLMNLEIKGYCRQERGKHFQRAT